MYSETDWAGGGGDDRTTVRLLGGFSVSRGGREIGLSGDGRRLVAFLALRGSRVSRAFVAGSLWFEGTQERAFGNLRSALWRVRSNVSDLIEADGDMVCLAEPDVVDVDVHVAGQLAEQLFAPGSAVSHDRCPIDLFTKELLPGWYDEFVLVERESLRQQALHALEAIADRLRLARRHGAAMQAAMAAVRLDCLRESAHRSVIRIHLAEGNYSEARRHHEAYAELLCRELGLATSPGMDELLASIPEVAEAPVKRPQRPSGPQPRAAAQRVPT